MAPEAPLAAEAGEEHARTAVLRNTPFTVSAAAVRAAAERFGEIEAVRQAKRTFFVLFAAAAAAEAAREAGNVRRVGPVAPRGGVRAAAQRPPSAAGALAVGDFGRTAAVPVHFRGGPHRIGL